jgi:DNA-binding transcriptional ArsR family regulator
MDNNPNEEMLMFFKALADANRLKILGLLARDELSVEELAETLGLRPSTISHHLSRLADAGLVSARASSYYSIYRLETKVLEDAARRFLSQDSLPALAMDVDLDKFARKVIQDLILPDGRLKTIPVQRKKLDVILRFILPEFESGAKYSEKQVNEILARFHADTATLRRELIGGGMLARSRGGSEYWKPDK